MIDFRTGAVHGLTRLTRSDHSSERRRALHLGLDGRKGAVTVGYPNQVLPKKNMRSVIPIMLTSARKLMGEKGDRASRVCFARQT